MENISLSIINLRTNKEIATAAGQIYLNKSPDFQRDYEAWNDKLRTRFIESIILNRATNPIWILLNDDENSEEILDGMHRITTALAFFNNDFCIHANHLMSLDKEKYNKKFYKDLNHDDMAKVRNYNFVFNKLDSSYRKDKNKLRDMYEILNRSSISLSDYEFNKVIMRPFYDIISKHKEALIKTDFFHSVKDTRGNVDANIIEMIALSYQTPSSWTSIASLTNDWIKKSIGETYEDVNSFVEENADIIDNKLKLMVKIISDFYQKGSFSSSKSVFKTLCLPYKFVVSRCCFLIKDYSLFNRLSQTINEKFNQEIFVDDLPDRLECNSRNAEFQRKLIKKIDEIINTELNKEGNTRRFSKTVILEKLREQNHMCPKCNTLIKEGDKYEGDHILSWTAGGPTLPENLQVLHTRCHQLKAD
jgi:hypothetical protein